MPLGTLRTDLGGIAFNDLQSLLGATKSFFQVCFHGIIRLNPPPSCFTTDVTRQNPGSCWCEVLEA